MWISSEELMITKLLTVSNKLGIHARPAIPAGSEVKFEIDGEDEELVVQQLEKLFDDHFNEEPC